MGRTLVANRLLAGSACGKRQRGRPLNAIVRFNLAECSSTVRKIIAAFLLAPTVVLAGWINKSGETLPESDNRKAVGTFGAQLVFVANEDELFKRWNTPSETVDISSIDKVAVNGAINAFIIFSGCTADKSGNCSVSMRFRVLQPDGKVYAETPPMEVWDEKPAPPGRSLELSVQYLKVVIEPKDQLGKYVVYAQVRDDRSGVVLQLNGPFTAVRASK